MSRRILPRRGRHYDDLKVEVEREGLEKLVYENVYKIGGSILVTGALAGLGVTTGLDYLSDQTLDPNLIDYGLGAFAGATLSTPTLIGLQYKYKIF